MMPIVASLLAFGFAGSDVSGFRKLEAFDAQDLSYFVGTYDVVGRDYWTGRPFTSRATVTLTDTLNVIWQDARGSTSAVARTELCGADKIRVLHLVFRQRGSDMEGLCHSSSELDNYPRITCQLERPTKDVAPPGFL